MNCHSRLAPLLHVGVIILAAAGWSGLAQAWTAEEARALARNPGNILLQAATFDTRLGEFSIQKNPRAGSRLAVHNADSLATQVANALEVERVARCSEKSLPSVGQRYQLHLQARSEPWEKGEVVFPLFQKVAACEIGLSCRSCAHTLGAPHLREGYKAHFRAAA